MADIRIDQLTSITPASADSIPVWDSSASLTGRFTVADLTTLLQSTFATQAGGNTFTGTQNITGNVIVSGVLQGLSTDGGSGEVITLSAGGNNNASTPHPGLLVTSRVSGAAARLYCDNSGIWRTRLTAVNNSNYATGDVVGAQTSSLDSKDLTGEPVSGADALASIVQAAQEAIKRFVYKPATGYDDDGNESVGDRPYNGEEFSGIVVDFAPRYGMDRDDEHPHGKSLNTINAIGDLMLAVNYLAEQNTALQTRIEALES